MYTDMVPEKVFERTIERLAGRLQSLGVPEAELKKLPAVLKEKLKDNGYAVAESLDFLKAAP